MKRTLDNVELFNFLGKTGLITVTSIDATHVTISHHDVITLTPLHTLRLFNLYIDIEILFSFIDLSIVNFLQRTNEKLQQPPGLW